MSAGPLPKTLYPHDDALQPPTYDLAKAKQLLTDAGYANGFKMTLTFAVKRAPLSQDRRLVKESYAKSG